MSSIRDIFACTPKRITFKGVDAELRRPSALDLLEALQVGKDTPQHLYAWFVYNHLQQDGQRVFGSVAEVLASYAPYVAELGREIELLYEEGRD